MHAVFLAIHSIIVCTDIGRGSAFMSVLWQIYLSGLATCKHAVTLILTQLLRPFLSIEHLQKGKSMIHASFDRHSSPCNPNCRGWTTLPRASSLIRLATMVRPSCETARLDGDMVGYKAVPARLPSSLWVPNTALVLRLVVL